MMSTLQLGLPGAPGENLCIVPRQCGYSYVPLTRSFTITPQSTGPTTTATVLRYL